MSSAVQDAAYFYALRQVRGISNRLAIRIAAAFSEPESLLGATCEQLAERLGQRVGPTLLSVLRNEWSVRWPDAVQAIEQHHEMGVAVIAFTNEAYPALLKLIRDPPPLLFAKGNLSALNRAEVVAIVGTRGPTDCGKRIARRIARHFAESRYAVVSGLAKGIDTEAHIGALEAGGVTIAVLATPLDMVYPAENRALSERIVDEAGLLVTEAPLGKRISRTAFVQRNRIQSGLSLAVIPVQTDKKGGTMHTVRFAEQQGRLLYCPMLTEENQREWQNAGILELVQSGRAQEFVAENYDDILLRLRQHKEDLIARLADRHAEEGPAPEGDGQRTLGFNGA